MASTTIPTSVAAAMRSMQRRTPAPAGSTSIPSQQEADRATIELGQTVHYDGSGDVGVVIGLGRFLIGGQQALVQRPFGPAGHDAASEWIDLERLAPIGRTVLEPYCEIPPRSPIADGFARG